LIKALSAEKGNPDYCHDFKDIRDSFAAGSREERQDCHQEAMRICGHEVPNVERIAALSLAKLLERGVLRLIGDLNYSDVGMGHVHDEEDRRRNRQRAYE
jgi:hypothetical protein